MKSLIVLDLFWIVISDLDSDFVTFFSNDIDLNNIILGNINLYDDSFDDSDLETFGHVRLIAWNKRFKQRKVCKKR